MTTLGSGTCASQGLAYPSRATGAWRRPPRISWPSPTTTCGSIRGGSTASSGASRQSPTWRASPGSLPPRNSATRSSSTSTCGRAGGPAASRRVFDLTANRVDSPLYPYTAGTFGAGANFAVSRAVLKEVGGFNEALGAGAPCGGGEDLNMFMRIVLAGHRLVYEPAAVVWHVHRTDLAELSRQMRAYGTGCTAALTAIVLADARARRELPTKFVSGVLHMRKHSSGVRDNPTLPSGLMRREIRGLLAGPWLYLRGLAALRGGGS